MDFILNDPTWAYDTFYAVWDVIQAAAGAYLHAGTTVADWL